MNVAERKAIFQAMVKAELNLLDSKGDEYSSDSDCLDNFKGAAADLGVSPLVVLATFANKHYRSIMSYIRKGYVTSDEPIEGRIQDLRNYLLLLQCLIKDLDKEKKTVTESE